MKNVLITLSLLVLMQGILSAQEKKTRDDLLKPGEEVFVCVKRSTIFQGADDLTPTVAKVTEGKKVKVLEDKTGPGKIWTKVDYSGQTGYIRRTAIVKQEFFIPSDSAEKTPDVQKLQAVGASKGFNPQVEKDYSKKENLGAQFSLLDTEVIPKPLFKSDQGDLARYIREFAIEGGLTQ